MNRRRFLRSTGLVGGGALVAAGVSAATTQERDEVILRRSGHAVGEHRPAGLTGTTVTYRVRTAEPVVALTFDDGPSARYTGAVLDLLEAADVVATFNLVGRQVARYPALARRAAERHELGNHTWSHPNLSLTPAPEVTSELERAAAVIAEVTGVRPRTFRPPYGYFSGATVMVAAGMNLPVVLWDQAFDRHGQSAAANVDRLSDAVTDGSIVLGHDGGSMPCDVVVAALPELIKRLQGRGYRFVTTSQLLALDRPPAATA